MGAEAYRSRKRYIYALVFKHDKSCYIGQSVNPKRRLQQHLGPKGGWNISYLDMIVLHEFQGTKEQGEHLEYAYRLKAHRRGWKIYGLPHVYINPKKRATFAHFKTSLTLPWPKAMGSRRLWWLWSVVPLGAIALYML